MKQQGMKENHHGDLIENYTMIKLSYPKRPTTQKQTQQFMHKEGHQNIQMQQQIDKAIDQIHHDIFKPQVKSNWNTITIQKPLKIQTTHKINSISLSPDGKYIATAGDEGDCSIKIWDPLTGQQCGNDMNGHTKPINSIDYSKCGKYILSGSQDGTIRQWNVQTQEQIYQTITLDSNLRGVYYSPDQKYIVSFQYEYIKVWDPLKCQEYIDKRKCFPPTPDTYSWDGEVYPTDNSEIIRVALSPIKYHAVIGGYNQTVVWDYDICQGNGYHLQGHCTRSFSVQYSTDGTVIAAADGYHNIQLWDAESRELILKIKTEENVYSVRISPDMRYLLIGSGDGFQIWNREARNKVCKLKMKWSLQRVLFSLDGKYVIAGGGDAALKILVTQV